MTERSRIVVTGATGFIGSRLVTRARAAGLEVRTYSRSLQGITPDVPPAERFVGTLPCNPPAGLLDGADAVVHCAGWVSGRRTDEAEAVNVRGTLHLAECAARAGVGTFVFLSTQSATPAAASAYGRSKLAAEQALASRFSAGPMAVVILRLGLVTGPGTRGLYPRLARLARRAPLVPIVAADALVQPIHLDDVCTALLRCAERGQELRGRTLCLGWQRTLTLERFVRALSEARSGRRKPVVPVPPPAVALAVHLAERLGIPAPVTSENLQGAGAVTPMDTRADMAALGLPERSLEEILRDDLAIESALALEVERMGRYLVGCAPGPTLAARYVRALDRLRIDIAPDEERAWRLARRWPSLLRIVDGGLALVKPSASIRHRLHILLAILEASPDHCDAFLPRASGLGARLGVLGSAARAGAAGAVGTVLVRLLGVKSS